jgi:hypothetical protein
VIRAATEPGRLRCGITIGGDQADNSTPAAGAVYVYRQR